MFEYDISLRSTETNTDQPGKNLKLLKYIHKEQDLSVRSDKSSEFVNGNENHTGIGIEKKRPRSGEKNENERTYHHRRGRRPS